MGLAHRPLADMKVLVRAALRRALRVGRPEVGILVTPRHWHRSDLMLAARMGLTWAADNDGFGGVDGPRYLRMLRAISGVPDCRFVTVPDVVFDAATTLHHFASWEPVVRDFGLPPALVTQDGMTTEDVPWSRVEAVFVGGSDVHKEGADARSIVEEAQRRGLWTHMGRVNTVRRLRLAVEWGVDSVDGSSYAMFSDTKLPRDLATVFGRLQDGDAKRVGGGGRLSEAAERAASGEGEEGARREDGDGG